MDMQKHNELIKEFADCQRQSIDKKLSNYSKLKAKRRMIEISDIFDKEYGEEEHDILDKVESK